MRRALVVLTVVLALPSAADAASSTLAFTEGTASGVYTIPVSGGSPTALSGGFVPSFSPNGKLMAFVNSNGVLFTGPANGKGGRHTIASNLGEHPGPAAFSPNSKQVAYASGSGSIYVANVTGIAPPKRIYQAKSNPSQVGDQFGSHPVWAPNGKTIYFVQGQNDLYGTVYAPAAVSAAGGAVTRLPTSLPQDWNITQFSLSVSSTGKTLALTLSQNTPTAVGTPGPLLGFGVGLIPVAGGSVSVIAGYTAPAFAPTGSTMCAQTSAGLVTLTVAGVASAPIATGVSPTACTWVPGAS